MVSFVASVAGRADSDVDASERDTSHARESSCLSALPPAELAAHPTDGDARAELYLMCDNVEETVAELSKKGAEFTGPISEQSWGRLSYLRVPGGGELGLYEPKHPSALGFARRGAS